MTATDQPDRRRSSLAVWLIAGAVLLLPLYVLSIGPAYWAVRQGYLPPYIGVCYAPVAIVFESCEPLRKASAWYMKTWE